MVKNVVRPARNSVVNLAFGISFAFGGQSYPLKDEVFAYMTGSIQMEILPNDRGRYPVIESSLVALNETHLYKFVLRKSKTGWW
jgi:hypothetical protein